MCFRDNTVDKRRNKMLNNSYDRKLTIVRQMTHEHEAYNHERETFNDDDLSEPERYDTITGWEPKYQHQKLLDDYRKNNPEFFCRDSMFTTKPARRWQQAKDERRTPKAELYGPMWRTGELAVLFGETGAGKSILAVQIAESIARGRSALSEPGAIATGFLKLPTANRQLPTAQSVLYLDLAHSAEQFDERYSCPSPVPGKLPVRYRFSPKLHRAGFGDLEIPKAFDKNFTRYFEHSIKVTIEESPAKVIIIDNLSWLAPATRNAASAQARWLRSLKLYCTTTGASILVLASAKPRRPMSPLSSPVSRLLSLSDLAPGPQIADPADSVFAIGRSVTFAEDIRYVKPVRTGSGSDRVLPRSGDVLTYQLERSSGFAGERSGKKTKSSESLSLSTVHYPLSTGSPFLGLKYLGVSPESDLLRDYEREAREEQAREQARLKKLRDPRHVVDMVLSREYQRYLER